MSFFLSGQALSEGMILTLGGEEAGHLLQSRRMQAGERFALQDPEGRRFSAALISAGRREAEVRIGAALALPPPPPRRVVLLQAAVKEKAAEWIVQKATELGVAELVFFPSEYSTVPRKTLEAPKNLARWERIAWEACKQSDRQFPPRLSVAAGLAATLAAHPVQPPPGAAGWLLHPGGASPLAMLAEAAALENQTPENKAPGMAGRGSACLSILVGPEGGWKAQELASMAAAGFLAIDLGGNILRAETAALVACALALTP